MTPPMMTMTKKSFSKTVPAAARKELLRLQQRYRSLLRMLPFDPVALDCLDAAEFDAAMSDVEVIAAEMQKINDEQLAILNELERR